MEVNDVRLNPTTIDNIAILHHSAFIRLYRDTHKKFPLWAQALFEKDRDIRGLFFRPFGETPVDFAVCRPDFVSFTAHFVSQVHSYLPHY